MALLGLHSEKLGFPQNLGQAAGDGECSHCPGRGDQDRSPGILWAGTRRLPFGEQGIKKSSFSLE